MIDAGLVLQQHKDGNDCADEAAEEAVQLHGLPLVMLGHRLSHRFKTYVAFLHQLLEHMVFVYLVRDQLLQQEGHRQPQDQNIPPLTKPARHVPTLPAHIPTTLIWQQTPERLTQLIKAEQCKHMLQKHEDVLHIQAFLLDMPYHRTEVEDLGLPASSLQPSAGQGAQVEPPRTSVGITWLELYILYRHSTHAPPTHTATAHTTSTLRHQLCAFRRAVRKLVVTTCAPRYHKLVKGIQKPAQRLQHLGIDTHLAVLPFQPHCTHEMFQQIAKEVLRSQRLMSQAGAQALLEQHKEIPVHRLQLKGRVKWMRGLKQWPRPLYSNTTLPTVPPAQTTPCPTHGPITPLPNIVLLTCPTCGHAVDGTRQAFNINNLDGRTHCKRCRRDRFVRLWQCTCQVPWYECPVHSGEPARLRHQAQSAQPTAPAAAAPPPPQRKHTRSLGEGKDQQVTDWLDRQRPRAPHVPPRESAHVDLTPVRPKRPSLPSQVIEDTSLHTTHTARTTQQQLKRHCLGPKLTAKLQQWQAGQATAPAGSSNDHLTTQTATGGQDTRSHHIPPPCPPAAGRTVVVAEDN